MSTHLLEHTPLRRRNHDDHSSSYVTLLETPVGTTKVLTEYGDLGHQDLVVSGLCSYGDYVLAACADVQHVGHSGNIMRKGNNRNRGGEGTIEADAIETAGAIDMLGSDGGQVSLLLHSLGGVVGTEAVKLADPSVDIDLIVFYNPAGFADISLADFLLDAYGRTHENAVNMMLHPGRTLRTARVMGRELRERGPAIMGEIEGLQTHRISKRDILDLKERKHEPVLMLAVSENDHMTPAGKILDRIDEIGIGDEFDAIITIDGPSKGSHNGILLEESVMPFIMSYGGLLVDAKRGDHTGATVSSNSPTQFEITLPLNKKD